MSLEWDWRKYQRNLFKHGLNFRDAELVFDGPCLTLEDERFGDGEQRFVTPGSLAGRVVVIAHTPRGENTRIISMRKANSRERKHYDERLEAPRRADR
ncbi:MAG: BrnT family toxin [Acidobacteriota bacterium]